jgi:hypothetical protein
MESQLQSLSIGETPAGPFAAKFVARPGVGKTGRPVRLTANYFELTSVPSHDLWHYDVTVMPDVPPPVNRMVFHVFEQQVSAQYGTILIVAKFIREAECNWRTTVVNHCTRRAP